MTTSYAALHAIAIIGRLGPASASLKGHRHSMRHSLRHGRRGSEPVRATPGPFKGQSRPVKTSIPRPPAAKSSEKQTGALPAGHANPADPPGRQLGHQPPSAPWHQHAQKLRQHKGLVGHSQQRHVHHVGSKKHSGWAARQ
ncbi:hypothetical protein J3E74DRAFT_287664 [Bipolaris maydis]|nr:hypothetical protein J3E74DRAFT_287664 [Bipolaris maydis]